MSTLAGTATMIRFFARRERVRVPVYLLVMAGLIASTAAQSEALYSTQAERNEYAATVAAIGARRPSTLARSSSLRPLCSSPRVWRPTMNMLISAAQIAPIPPHCHAVSPPTLIRL